MVMRTNIEIDDILVKQAMELAGQPTKRAVVNQALEEFVANHSRKDLRDLFGKVDFVSSYDYKALREGRPA